MLILRNKTFAKVDYAGLSETGKKMLKEFRSGIAKDLVKKRKTLPNVKDKRLKEALAETYRMGAKGKAEISRKAAEMM